MLWGIMKNGNSAHGWWWPDGIYSTSSGTTALPSLPPWTSYDAVLIRHRGPRKASFLLSPAKPSRTNHMPFHLGIAVIWAPLLLAPHEVKPRQPCSIEHSPYQVSLFLAVTSMLHGRDSWLYLPGNNAISFNTRRMLGFDFQLLYLLPRWS